MFQHNLNLHAPPAYSYRFHLCTKFIECSSPTLQHGASSSCPWVGRTVPHSVALFGPRLVHRRALKEPSHEGEAVLLDVGFPSERVEDGIGAAADEGERRRHRPTGLGDVNQSEEKLHFRPKVKLHKHIIDEQWALKLTESWNINIDEWIT